MLQVQTCAVELQCICYLFTLLKWSILMFCSSNCCIFLKSNTMIKYYLLPKSGTIFVLSCMFRRFNNISGHHYFSIKIMLLFYVKIMYVCAFVRDFVFRNDFGMFSKIQFLSCTKQPIYVFYVFICFGCLQASVMEVCL